MINLPFENALAELKKIMVEAGNLPDHNPFLMPDDEPFVVKSKYLPMAALEFDEEGLIIEGTDNIYGSASINITSVVTVRCWFFKEKTKEIKNVLDEIRNMMNIIKNDNRKLNGTVTRCKLNAFDYWGSSKDWPLEIEEGIGAIGGYLSLSLGMVES